VVRPVQLGRERLAARIQRLPQPETLLSPYSQRLDSAAERLRRGLGEGIVRGRTRLQRAEGRLSLPLLNARIERARDRLGALARFLGSLDPDRVLQRGYVRVSAASGRTVMDKAAAAGQPGLVLHFRDGDLAVTPGGGAQPRAAPRPKPPPGEQGKLL
jgi:exodeoxyribonuclease VII large subunit